MPNFARLRWTADFGVRPGDISSPCRLLALPLVGGSAAERTSSISCSAFSAACSSSGRAWRTRRRTPPSRSTSSGSPSTRSRGLDLDLEVDGLRDDILDDSSCAAHRRSPPEVPQPTLKHSAMAHLSWNLLVRYLETCLGHRVTVPKLPGTSSSSRRTSTPTSLQIPSLST